MEFEFESKTPAEAAGITVEGENKWLTIIQNASSQRTRGREGAVALAGDSESRCTAGNADGSP